MVKVTYLSLFVAALLAKEVAALSSSSNLFDDWSQHDLIQYMKDNGQKTFSSKDGLEELRKQVAESFTKSKEQAPWWKFWESDSSSTDGFGVHSKNEVVDWLFNTWPADSLKKLLKDARISVAGEASKDELINTLKQNFKKVSQHLGVSGYYPSEAFFKGWSVDDMKSWLDQYGISYDKAKASKDELLSAVRKNMHRASRYADDERFEMLSSLDLVNEKFTETGNFDHVDFSKWSVDDLKKWLHLHGVQLGNKVANNRDELVEVATSKKDLLKDDLNWLVEVADRKWDSILKDSTGLGSTWDKTKEKIGGLTDMFKGSPEDEGIINDTFLVDVENWPKDRLREFLDARGVTYSMLSTRNDLLDLVKKYKNKPLQSWMDVTSKWFHGLSSKDSTGDDESTLEKGGKKAKDKLKSIGSDIRTGTAKVSDSVNKKFDDWSSVFDSWSTEELTEYLKSFGIHAPKASKKKLVNLAKSNSKSFFGSFNEESGLYSYLPRKVREWARYGTSYLLNR